MNIALIIGCARSGTSILGELIGSHPEVNYIFEAHHIWEIAGLGVNESHRLLDIHATPEVKEKIREYFKLQQGESKIVVEKCPRNVLRVPFVRAVFPEAKIIHVIRDGRDVVCSLLPGIGGDEWGHLRPPTWKILMQNYEGIKRCALAYKAIMEIALQDLKLVPHFQISYEDLVLEPNTIADNIFNYLGLRASPETKEFCGKIQDDIISSYHAQHQERWFTDNHRKRIGRWRENLTEDQQREVY